MGSVTGQCGPSERCVVRGRATLTENVSLRLALALRPSPINRDTVGREQGAFALPLNRPMGGFAGRRFEPMGWSGEQAERVKAMAETTE